MMNALILSLLALASADEILHLPIFRNTTKVSIPDKQCGLPFDFEKVSFYADITVNGATITTHLEPHQGRIWLYDDQLRDQRSRKYDPKWRGLQDEKIVSESERGNFFRSEVSFGEVTIPDQIFEINFTHIPPDQPKIGGFGLGPSNTSAEIFLRPGSPNNLKIVSFAERVKNSNLAISEAFTINLSENDYIPDTVTYGALDLSRFRSKFKRMWMPPSGQDFVTEFTVFDMNVKATFDIEEPNSYLDDNVVKEIAKFYNAVWDEDRELYKLSHMPSMNPILDFGGVRIPIPPSNIWKQDTNVDKDNWYLTIRPKSADPSRSNSMLGADIMKSIYILYDLPHGFVAFSQAHPRPGRPNYLVIPTTGMPSEYFA